MDFSSLLLTMARRTVITRRVFHRYVPLKGPIAGQWNDVLVLCADKKAVLCALWSLKPRRTLFDRRVRSSIGA